MTGPRWEQVRAVLEEALEQAPAARHAFVARVCSGDEELAREVEQYLACEERANRVLPVSEWMKEAPEDADPPDDIGEPERLGPYRVLHRIGEGGMGAVYLAERDDGEYRQQVALKVLKPGRQRARLLRLFRQERQILARLEHPNIAHLLDGGTAGGQIYYAMEHVEGMHITAYCRERGLPVRRRLQLFVQVCEAVSHAHRNLVIHGDLKPGNILVTADGVCKLLDFGLARAFAAANSQEAASISAGPLLTPAYASPEQVRGEPLGTATDIYSLAVLLYELLTGWNPHLRGQASPLEVCRAVCEADPPPPSGLAEPGLRRQLDGDLDNIMLMALRKEPERRYRSVDQFRADIECYLAGYPVHASRGTAWYRFRKYAARHRRGLAVSALGAVAFLAAAAMIWWEGREARVRFNDVRSLAHSVIFDLHDAIQDLPGSTAARKLLVERALEYLRRLERDRGNDSQLELELAAAYDKIGSVQAGLSRGNLGDTAAALESLLRARQLLEHARRSAPEPFEVEKALGDVTLHLAELYEERGEEAHRVEASRQAADLAWGLARREPTARILRALALSRTAENLNSLSEWRKAAPVWQQAIGDFEAAARQDPNGARVVEGLANAHDGMARCDSESNDLPGARQHLQEALRLLSGRLDKAPASVGLAMKVSFVLIDLAWVEHELRQYRDSVAHSAQALALQLRVASADPDNFAARLEAAKTLLTTGLIYRNASDFVNSTRCLKDAAGRFESALIHDTNNQSTLYHLVWSLAELGNTYIRRAGLPDRGKAQIQADWEAAQVAYSHAATYLPDLRLSGKLMGIHDLQLLKEGVTEGLAMCRRELARVR